MDRRGASSWACQVGSFDLSPGFRHHLEAFYQKSSPEDQARCLELLTALDIGEAIRQNAPPHDPHPPKRPKTAMASIGVERGVSYNVNGLSPYMTTYGREYAGQQGVSAHAHRPGSTARAYEASYELAGPIGNSTYASEFCTKSNKITQPIRTGSASGNRRNNPHPLEGFMNWRLCHRPVAEQEYSEWSRELTDDVMDRVCRGKLNSTYQVDYLGLPQGCKPKKYNSLRDIFPNSPVDARNKVPYSLDSSMRHSYQNPNMEHDLKGNTKRYGCNKNKYIPANGVVPTVPSRQLHMTSRTSYERDFNDPPVRIPNVRDMARKYGASAVASYMQGTQGQDRETLERMLKTLDPQQVRGRRESRDRKSMPSNAPALYSKHPPSYCSTFVGPV